MINRNAPILSRTGFKPFVSPRELVKKLEETFGFTFVRHGENHDIYKSKEGSKISIPRQQRDLNQELIVKIMNQANLDVDIIEFMQK